MTADEFRRLALSFPDAAESAHTGHPDFRVGGKIFATLGYPDEKFAVVMVTPQDQDFLVKDFPKTFAPVKGKWGESGSTMVTLRSASKRGVSLALDAAWRKRAPKRLIRSAEDVAER